MTKNIIPSKYYCFLINALLRMIKEAKKEKGTDDFLGNIVLRLQVIKTLNLLPYFTVDVGSVLKTKLS